MAFVSAILTDFGILGRLGYWLSCLIFLFTVPFAYGVGGAARYGRVGWSFWQPGLGGRRFVVLNAVAWSLYGFTLLLILPVQIKDTGMDGVMLAAGAVGLLAVFVMITALLSFQPHDAKSDNEMFNEDLQKDLMTYGVAPSLYWWCFLGMQLFLTVSGWFLCMICDLYLTGSFVRPFVITLFMWLVASSVSITHAMAGKWKHTDTNYQGTYTFYWKHTETK